MGNSVCRSDNTERVSRREIVGDDGAGSTKEARASENEEHAPGDHVLGTAPLGGNVAASQASFSGISAWVCTMDEEGDGGSGDGGSSCDSDSLLADSVFSTAHSLGWPANMTRNPRLFDSSAVPLRAGGRGRGGGRGERRRKGEKKGRGNCPRLSRSGATGLRAAQRAVVKDAATVRGGKGREESGAAARRAAKRERLRNVERR